jgi:hypothetical protein
LPIWASTIAIGRQPVKSYNFFCLLWSFSMLSLRQFGQRARIVAGILLLEAAAVSQAGRLPSLLISDAPDGVRISASGSTLPDARVLRLSHPDRLVLDFDHTELNISTAERERWKARGIRMAYHAEDGSTRVVFDIPAGEQRWMKRQGTSLIVQSSSTTAQRPTVEAAKPFVPRRRDVPSPVSVAGREGPIKQVGLPRPVTNLNREVQDETQSGDADHDVPEPGSRLMVSSQRGLLQVSARGVSFKAILDQIASATGATVQTITPIDDTKREVFEYGPAPPMEVIKKFFEGSPYNYLLVSEPNDSTRISRIVVTSTLKMTEGNDGPVYDDDTNPENLSGIAPLAKPKPEEKKPD